jgi:hypothetical protein
MSLKRHLITFVLCLICWLMIAQPSWAQSSETAKGAGNPSPAQTFLMSVGAGGTFLVILWNKWL